MNFNEFKKGLKKEYNNTFKNEKKRIDMSWFKARYVLYLLGLFLLGFLIGEHIYVDNYNEKVELSKMEYYDKLSVGYEKGIDLIKVNSSTEYKALLSTKKFVEKESILESIFSFKMGCSQMSPGDGLMNGDAMAPEADFNPGNSIDESIGNSFNTNIQTSGVDESDVSKCDGKYIYKYYDFNIFIFDLTTTDVVATTNMAQDAATYHKNKPGLEQNEFSYYDDYEMYVKNDDIILVGSTATLVYTFIDNTLKLKDLFYYNFLNDSRLVDEYLYVVYSNYTSDNLDYENLYYDGYCNTARVYSIVKYNLSTNQYNKVDNLNAGDVILYVSNKHFYLATSIYSYYGQMTLVSIFDFDLNPITALKVTGTVLNQFSMDEHENQFRIVHTDSSKESTRWNAITIFDLDKLERIGYLDEGIGLDRHTVRSVTFDDNTCYVVTYENRDPLYEIDLTDPTKPYIVSFYEAPGYSKYLHKFNINDKKYLFGLGVLDNQSEYKISVYIDDGATTQIGKDFIISQFIHNEVDYKVDRINYLAFENHKALFLYNDGTYMYIGIKASNKYAIFKIDVTQEKNVVSLYKEYSTNDDDSRCYLVDYKLYITDGSRLITDTLN